MIFEGFDRVWCFLFMTASIYSLGMISWFLQAMQYPNVLCGSYWPVHFLTSYRLLLSTSLQSDEVKFQQTYMQVVGSKGPRFCSHRYVVNPPLALKSVQCRAIGIRLNTPKRWQLEIWHEISSPHNWLFPHMKTTIFCCIFQDYSSWSIPFFRVQKTGRTSCTTRTSDEPGAQAAVFLREFGRFRSNKNTNSLKLQQK